MRNLHDNACEMQIQRILVVDYSQANITLNKL